MRYRIRVVVCLCTLSWAIGHHDARAQSLSFDHLTPEQGLSESTVLAITQDAEGFMWFGTRDGLNRYDARKIRIYRSDKHAPGSLSDDFIYALLSDRRGRLWIGTRNGLNLFEPGTDSFRKFFAADSKETLSDNTVTSIIEDRDGNKWIGTRHGLNLMIEKDSVSFMQFFHQPGSPNSLVNDDIRSIFQDEDGIVWIGTSNGFSRLQYQGPGNFSVRSFRLPKVRGKYEKNNSVNTFQEDAYGRLIIGTERNGLIFLDKRTFEMSDVFQDPGLDSRAVRSILKDPSGNFWIGTIGGLFLANHDFSRIKLFRNVADNPASLSDNSIRSLFYDRDGSYWIGTFHGGVSIHSPLAKQFRHLQPRMNGQKVSLKVASALTSDDDGNLWIGTEGNGLFLIDNTFNVRAHFKHDETDPNSISHDNVKCLLQEEGRGIWIGTIKGLDFYDFETKTFTHFRNEPGKANGLPDDVIYDLAKHDDGRLWVATFFGGLVRFDPRLGTVDNVYTHQQENSRTLTSRTVTRVYIDSKKNVWAGTASGLNKLRADGSFARFLHSSEDSESVPGIYVTAIFEDTRNRIWVGTRGAGLYLLNNNGTKLRHLTESDGLPGTTVYGIQEDTRGYLWISTENGLSRFDSERIVFKNYNRDDGLLCKEFNFNSYHRDRAGHFYFGGYNGVAFFHPDSTYENRVVPSVAFTAVRLFNREIVLDDGYGIMRRHVNYETSLDFRHNQNIFSVEFAVLNYINSARNQFAYRLDGFEEEWNYVREPFATYMNLAPGSYTLLVKGSNNDGVWNETPRMLAIHIHPPPWKTWWAYTGYCVAVLSLFFGWAYLNKKQITLKHELQLEHFEKLKQEELHQAKLNFFTNIAHEIRTPVTLIASPIEHLLQNYAHHSTLKKELGLVRNNADRLMRLLNQLLDFQKQETGNVRLKVAQGNVVSLIGGVVESFREFAQSRKVALRFEVSSSDIQVWYDREELAKVFFNLLVNALKFTPGGGEVMVSVSSEEIASGGPDAVPAGKFVKIVVLDNGLGMSASHLEKIFHRFYQAENTGIQDAGFGIGLALSKGIIDLHRGTISVDSREATAREPGFTKFTIHLPEGKDHFSPAEIMPEPEDFLQHLASDNDLLFTSTDKREVSGKPLILLVDDDEDLRTYLRGMLSPQYEILEGGNGNEGLAIAVERLPDLVVSDIMMPFMNGIELVSKLKADDRTNHIPVILLTARGTINHQVEGLETGADDYLTKPFNTNLLAVKIRNLLGIREKLKGKYCRMVSLQPAHQEVESPDDHFLQRLMKILEDNLEYPGFNVSKLVKEIGMSRPVLFRKTKMLTGLSVIDLLRNVRLKKAEMLLRQKKLSISEIAFTVGFSDPKYFSKAFRHQFGKTPSQYADECEG